MFSDVIVINFINSASAPLLGDLHYAYLEADLRGVLKEANESFCDGAGYFQNESVGRHYRPFTDPANIELTIHILHRTYGAGASLKRFGRCGEERDSTVKAAEGWPSWSDTEDTWRGFRGILGYVRARQSEQHAFSLVQQPGGLAGPI